MKNQLIVVKLIVSTMQQTIKIKNLSNFTIVAAIIKLFNNMKIHKKNRTFIIIINVFVITFLLRNDFDNICYSTLTLTF